MTIGELKKLIEDMDDDYLVLKPTASGTFVRATRVGTAKLIPTYQNENLIKGNEWRRPSSDKDEPDTERVRHFVVY